MKTFDLTFKQKYLLAEKAPEWLFAAYPAWMLLYKPDVVDKIRREALLKDVPPEVMILLRNDKSSIDTD